MNKVLDSKYKAPGLCKDVGFCNVLEWAEDVKSLSSDFLVERGYEENWNDLLGLYSVGGKLYMNDMDVNKRLKIVKGIISVIESFKNKSFHSELKNLPIIDNILKDFFKFIGADGRIESHPEGDVFVNKWVYNLLLLMLFTWSEKALLSGAFTGDALIDLKELVKYLQRGLDSSIRKVIASRGVKLYLSLFVGYDTEYVREHGIFRKNRLISSQLAGNTCVCIKIPKRYEYFLEHINAATSRGTEIHVEGKREEQFKRTVELCINEILNTRDEFQRKDYWTVMDSIKSVFSGVAGVRKNEKSKEFDLYQLPFTSVRKLVEIDKNAMRSVGADFTKYEAKKSEVEGAVKVTDNLENAGDIFNNAEYSIDQLVKKSNDLLDDNIKINSIGVSVLITKFLNLLKHPADDIALKIEKRVENAFSKRMSRFMLGVNGTKLSISTERNLFLTSHNTPSDLSLLKDFDVFKEELDIVQKFFVTRGRPLTGFNNRWQSRVFIRDTMLLSPEGAKSLKAIGGMHGFPKIDIGGYITDMLGLLKYDVGLFYDYAIRDGEIVVKHINEMAKTYFDLGKIGVPLTVTSLSKEYILSYWKKKGYAGYQLNEKYPLGNPGKVSSPRGVQTLGGIGLNLSRYSATFRGGRNESIMYGEGEGVWYDYDLRSAYTTAMGVLGDPVYKRMYKVTQQDLQRMGPAEFLKNYIAVETKFKFPLEVKYPCIPQSVDDTTTIYPRSGKSVITGFEYLEAKNSGCKFWDSEAYIIPYRVSGVKVQGKVFEEMLGDGKVDCVDFQDHAPFLEIEKEIQRERLKYPKGTFENMLEKLKGNAGYGLVCQGLSNKRKFDIKSKGMVVLSGGEISNPVIASSITAFIRSVISETLNNIERLGGRVLSVTTDGFITDIENLEEKLLTLDFKNIMLLKYYRVMRSILSGNPKAYEIKRVEKEGILSWCTRGQVGNTEILAATGFQARGYTRKEIYKEFKELKNGKNCLEFVQTSLRGAKEVYEKGGHVTMNFRDQSYRLVYDNKRKLLFSADSKLHDTQPWGDINACKGVRGCLNIVKSSSYSVNLSGSSGKSYKKPLELGIRAFLRWVMWTDFMSRSVYDTYEKIVKLVKAWDKRANISKSSISRIKNGINTARMMSKAVPRIEEVTNFFGYIELHIPEFKGYEILETWKS